jgi:hypothetical protein
MKLTLFRSALALVCLAALTMLLGVIIPVGFTVAALVYGVVRMATKPRAPWMHVGLPVLLALVVAPGFAFAASIDIGQALTGSLINGVVTALIAALVGWVAIVIKNKFNIDIEARHREAITAFAQRQASSLIAMGAVKLDGVKVEVHSQALADAANRALSAIPDALAFFGITPASIQQRIIDMLPKEPAVAQAQAVAIDAANPATPSSAAPAGL